MDSPVHDPLVIQRDLRNLAGLNRWLGGRRAVLKAVLPLLAPGPARILDVGSGGGDLPRALAAEAKRLGLSVRVTAADRHSQIIALARRWSPSHPDISFVRADALGLPFDDGCFDVVLMSLTLHHFEAGARAAVLRELGRVAKTAVIINELERCWPNYWGARLLAWTLWRNDPLARHDGPVSVLRAFTPGELAGEMRDAGLSGVGVRRRFFHRLIASATPPASGSGTPG